MQKDYWLCLDRNFDHIKQPQIDKVDFAVIIWLLLKMVKL